MSRVSVLEQLYSKKKSALEFNYDNLWAPPIRSLLSQEDINELIRIATSLKYNGDINKKYKLIDDVMKRRGFIKAHAGTNRVVYNFLEDRSFVAKIAVDRIGMKDTPAEYRNQEWFKPFCCKIFEVDPSGVIGFVERVNPITSPYEFLSVADDIFNMIVTKIVGKYVLDDIGATKFMNYGLRMNGFGPVILDFPYAFELDGAKLICRKSINTPQGQQPCGGEIDYDAGFDYLVCNKCGRKYQARDLAADTKDVLILNDKGGEPIMAKARLVAYRNGKKEIILDDCTSTKTYVSKEEYKEYTNTSGEIPAVLEIANIKHKRRPSREKQMDMTYNSFILKKLNKETNIGYKPFSELLPTVVDINHDSESNDINYDDCTDVNRHVISVPIDGYEQPVDDIDYDEIEDYIDDNSEEETIIDNTSDEAEDIIEESIEDSDEYQDNINDEENIAEQESSDEIDRIDLSLLGTDFVGSKVDIEEIDYSNYEPEETEDDYNDEEEQYDFTPYSYEDYVKDKSSKQSNKFKANKLSDEDMDNY